MYGLNHGCMQWACLCCQPDKEISRSLSLSHVSPQDVRAGMRVSSKIPPWHWHLSRSYLTMHNNKFRWENSQGWSHLTMYNKKIVWEYSQGPSLSTTPHCECQKLLHLQDL
jgi:hypothetical protein